MEFGTISFFFYRQHTDWKAACCTGFSCCKTLYAVTSQLLKPSYLLLTYFIFKWLIPKDNRLKQLCSNSSTVK